MTDDWRTIASAPRDGSVIELLGAGGKLDVGRWSAYPNGLDKAAAGIPDAEIGEFSTRHGEGPHTHWRPIVRVSDELNALISIAVDALTDAKDSAFLRLMAAKDQAERREMWAEIELLQCRIKQLREQKRGEK